MSISLIIPSAGIGKRFSKDIKKQFYNLDNKPLLFFTLKRMIESYNFDEIIIGLNIDDFKIAEDIISELGTGNKTLLVEGGAERADTVLNCLERTTCDYTAVHDAVRPFVSNATVKNTIEKAYKTGAAICGLPVRDTVKKASNNIILNTVSRENLFLAHTPQVFKTDILRKALKKSIDDNIKITDEASACEYCEIDVSIELSNNENIKVTYYEDIDLIEIYKNKMFR